MRVCNTEKISAKKPFYFKSINAKINNMNKNPKIGIIMGSDSDLEIMSEAAKICEENSMHYWDSLLAATMKQNGIFSIYTENTKDFKPKWLNAVNPFIKNSVKKIN